MNQKVTVSAVIPSEEKYLFVLNARDHKWSLPAGKIKLGESTEQALRREIREKICSRAIIHSLVGIYRFTSDIGRDITNFVYHATLQNGIPRGGEGIVQLQYLTIDEALEYVRLNQMCAPKANIRPIQDYEQGMRFPKDMIHLIRNTTRI